MASTYDELARLPKRGASLWAHASFAFGKPARRYESIARRRGNVGGRRGARRARRRDLGRVFG